MRAVDLQEPFFRQVVDQLPDLVCRFTPEGTLLYVNHAYARYFGSTPGALVGTNFLDLVPVDQRDQAEADLHDIWGLTPEHPTRIGEHRGGDLDGQPRWQEWVDKALFDAEGRLVALLAVGRDVTERRAAHELLRYYSEQDPLTGLLNRRSTLAALDAAVATAHGQWRGSIGLVYIDLDDFKQINDRHGHASGDRFLTVIAEILSMLFSGTGVVGRLGGDEFVIIFPGVPGRGELQAHATRIGDELALLTPPASASVGLAILEPGEHASQLLHRADQNMYARKQQRRSLIAR